MAEAIRKVLTSKISHAILFGILTQFLLYVDSSLYPSIQWTTTNTDLFSTTNCSKEDRGLYIRVPPMTKLYIVCPNPGIIMEQVESIVATDLLHENLIMVEEEDYNKCRYDNSKSRSTTRILMNCTHDDKKPLQYSLLIFQEYSAENDFISFKPGNNYFFISTSDGTKNSLTNNGGPGHCNDTNNALAIKMKVYVCKPNETNCDTTYTNFCIEKEKEDPAASTSNRSTGSVENKQIITYIYVAICGWVLWVVTLCVCIYLIREHYRHKCHNISPNPEEAAAEPTKITGSCSNHSDGIESCGVTNPDVKLDQNLFIVYDKHEENLGYVLHDGEMPRLKDKQSSSRNFFVDLSTRKKHGALPPL